MEMTFALIGEPLAVDLANTLLESEEGSVDLLANPGLLSAWCEAQGERVEILDFEASAGHLEEFLALRAAIREVFRGLLDGEHPSERAVNGINAASAGAPSFRELRWSEAQGELGVLRAGTGYLAGDDGAVALSKVARSAIELAGGPDRSLLRACPAPGCPLMFVARNRRRLWCRTVCGNRVRVARHYRRHH